MRIILFAVMMMFAISFTSAARAELGADFYAACKAEGLAHNHKALRVNETIRNNILNTMEDWISNKLNEKQASTKKGVLAIRSTANLGISIIELEKNLLNPATGWIKATKSFLNYATKTWSAANNVSDYAVSLYRINLFSGFIKEQAQLLRYQEGFRRRILKCIDYHKNPPFQGLEIKSDPSPYSTQPQNLPSEFRSDPAEPFFKDLPISALKADIEKLRQSYEVRGRLQRRYIELLLRDINRTNGGGNLAAVPLPVQNTPSKCLEPKNWNNRFYSSLPERNSSLYSYDDWQRLHEGIPGQKMIWGIFTNSLKRGIEKLDVRVKQAIKGHAQDLNQFDAWVSKKEIRLKERLTRTANFKGYNPAPERQAMEAFKIHTAKLSNVFNQQKLLMDRLHKSVQEELMVISKPNGMSAGFALIPQASEEQARLYLAAQNKVREALQAYNLQHKGLRHCFVQGAAELAKKINVRVGKGNDTFLYVEPFPKSELKGLIDIRKFHGLNIPESLAQTNE